MRNLAKTAAALLSAALLCLSGCSVSFVNLGGGVHYQHTESYTAGDREITEPITALDIEWPSGSVRVSAVSGSTVTIKETTDADLDDDLKVHSWTDGGVLRVRFCKSGVSYRKSAKKTLEITVPEDTVFEKISADSASADLVCDQLRTKQAVMDPASGNLSYTGTADSFRASTASGNISFSGEADEINTDAASGEISVVQHGKSGSISADTASGNITVEAEQTDRLKAHSASGEQSLRLQEMPQQTSLDSASGNVTMYLPEDADFTADISTASGSVNYELPLTKSDGSTYTCGSGANKLSIGTASGDVRLLKL